METIDLLTLIGGIGGIQLRLLVKVVDLCYFSLNYGKYIDIFGNRLIV